MTVKSVVDVEINDEAFKNFKAIFDRYTEALGATPGTWAKANAAAEGTAVSVESLVAGLLTMEAIRKKIAREEEEENRRLERTNKLVEKQRISYRDVAKTTASILLSIAKWASYTGVVGGLVGYGGLFGLDRLANLTGAGRRTAQGLGTTYGEAKAFETSYDRLVDARGFLGGVNEALTDVTKRVSLFGAGLTNSDLAGKDTAAVANELLPALKRIADKTPDSQLAQVVQARGLGQFVSVEDFRRLKATSWEELRGIQAGYGARARQFNVEDAVARKWQDLGVQLSAAKVKIESVLVTGFEKLSGPLARLSDHVADALANFIRGVDPKTIDEIGKGIDDFGKYLGSGQFRKDVKEFATDVSYAAKKMVSALKWLGLIPDKDAATDPDKPSVGDRARGAGTGTIAGTVLGVTAGTLLGGPAGGFVGGRIGAALGGAAGAILPNGVRLLGERAYAVGSPNWTNPGNIRWPGSTKFVRFQDEAAGVRALGRQLLLYQKRDHLDTIEAIVNKYAPKKDRNNVEAYIKDLVHETGFGAKQKLNLDDVKTLEKVISGITKHEGRRHVSREDVARYIGDDGKASAPAVSRAGDGGKDSSGKDSAAATKTPAAKVAARPSVAIVIHNNTGGSAIVGANQAGKQG